LRCVENQATGYTEDIFERMAAGEEASVPFIWPLEVANSLLRAERRKALKVAQVAGFREELSAWSIEVDTFGVGRAFHQILSAFRQHHLSAYDAAYLELAIREGLAACHAGRRFEKGGSLDGRQDRRGKMSGALRVHTRVETDRNLTVLPASLYKPPSLWLARPRAGQ